MKTRCKYCLKPIDTRGMMSHIHFRHRMYVAREFSLDSAIQWMWLFMEGEIPRFDQKQLPAPNLLTVYSTRPLGKMAAPLPWLRRPKGYELPYGYARPHERLLGWNGFRVVYGKGFDA